MADSPAILTARSTAGHAAPHMAGVVAQLTTVALAAHPDAQEQQHLPAR